LISAVLCDAYGWPFAFYAYGAAGFIWCILWFIFASNGPSESRWMTQEEKEAIKLAQGQQVALGQVKNTYFFRGLFKYFIICLLFFYFIVVHFLCRLFFITFINIISFIVV